MSTTTFIGNNLVRIFGGLLSELLHWLVNPLKFIVKAFRAVVNFNAWVMVGIGALITFYFDLFEAFANGFSSLIMGKLDAATLASPLGAQFQVTLNSAWGFVNAAVPLTEMFGLITFMSGVWLAINGIRLIIRWMPAIGYLFPSH